MGDQAMGIQVLFLEGTRCCSLWPWRRQDKNCFLKKSHEGQKGQKLPHWPFSVSAPGSVKLQGKIKTPWTVRIWCPPTELHSFSWILLRYVKWKIIFSQDSKMTYSFGDVFFWYQGFWIFSNSYLCFLTLPHSVPFKHQKNHSSSRPVLLELDITWDWGLKSYIFI